MEMLILYLYLCLLISFVTSFHTHKCPSIYHCPVNELLEKENITQDLNLDPCTIFPTQCLQILSLNICSATNSGEATMGSIIDLSHVQQEPKVNITFPNNTKSLVLLAMVDPDAPSRKNPTSRYVIGLTYHIGIYINIMMYNLKISIKNIFS